MTTWVARLFWGAVGPEGPRGDPFNDPVIARMGHRDLADLPLVPPPAPAPARTGCAAVSGRPLLRA